MSNNAAEYLSIYDRLHDDVADVCYYGPSFSGNEVAVALKISGIHPKQIKKVGCTFEDVKIYLTFEHFIEHFGNFTMPGGPDMPMLSKYVQTIHLENEEVYVFVRGDCENTTDTFILAHDPRDFKPYDKALIENSMNNHFRSLFNN